MRFVQLASAAAVLLALGACGQSGNTPDAAQATAGQSAAGELTAADRAAILSALGLSASAQGQVVNECGDAVTPSFLPAEFGGAVGAATLFAIGGGPSAAACYGDGPDLHLFMRDGASWREIYAARGRMLIILPSTTNGVRDIADGGPGFSFPVWTWNGRTFVNAGRSVSDDEAGGEGVTYLP